MGSLTIGAALLLGLVASGHCVIMCGGISAALGIATARRADGRPQVRLLVAYQLGRILSYSLAGLLIGGALGTVVNLLDIEAVRRALRAVSALALLLGALVIFGRVRDPGAGLGRTLWPKLAPLGRRLLPINSLPRATAFGMVWGWMPCGIVYTVLLIASLQANAANAAATMAAFGLGTAPAMLATAFGAHRFLGFTARPAGRRIAGTVLVACALITFATPWLVSSAPMLHGWLPFDCSPSK
jgi:sulfite exporter TauE/SafE